MADIRPFRAYRPAKGMEERIAALPYDVYSREEACAVVAENPDSFLAIDRAETQFDSTTDTYAPEVYEKAAEMLRERIEEGKFRQEDTPCYYLYELTMEGRSQTGIVACASIDDYCNNVIKKHENTRADKEADRIRHVDVCNMQTGPIFLAYRETIPLKQIKQEVKKLAPVYDFVTQDHVGHRVWVISKPEQIAAIRDAFAQIYQIYIADGHHRCASAVRVGLMRREQNPGYEKDAEFNYFLSVIFPDEELKILDYNRVVRDLNGLTEETFLEKIRQFFTVRIEISKQPDSIPVESKKSFAPEKKGQFGMYLNGTWYSLTAKESIRSEDAVKGLDVSVLQDYLLGPILGIHDPKTDRRIDFVGGIRGLSELMCRCTPKTPGAEPEMAVAFSMYPTSIRELFAVADAGLLMPPKSTWFEPKLRSGLFLHSLS